MSDRAEKEVDMCARKTEEVKRSRTEDLREVNRKLDRLIERK